jgi:hypothetical protein
LSNHARATVTGVTFDLGGGPISDGAMIVGSEKLTSATAGFSSLDLGKPVTITAAGLFVTTIASVVSPVQATLSAPAQRAVNRGPADVWRTDSGPGFQLLLASLDQLDVAAVEIVFDSGVYDFSRIPGGGTQGGVELNAVRDVTLRGSGPGVTTLRLMPNQDLTVGDTAVIELVNGKNITVRDLTVHGSHLTMAHVNVQMHGVEVNEGCEDITIERVKVFQATGDGLRLRGFGGNTERPEPNPVRRVRVHNSSFVENKRTGIAFQRALEHIWIRACYIEMRPPSTDSCIDFEPSGKLAPTDIIIDSNFLVHETPSTAVSLSGLARDTDEEPEDEEDDPDRTRRVQFINNTLHGGGLIGAVGARDVTLAHNTISVSNRGPAVRFRGDCSHLRIESNKIVATGKAHTGISVSRRKDAPDHVWISDNHIVTPGDGIVIENGGDNLDICGNRIFGNGAFIGINVTLTNQLLVEVHRDVKIDRNTIADFTSAGIQLKTGRTTRRFEGVSIADNEIYVAAADLPSGLVGIKLAAENGADEWLQRAIVSGNRIGENIQVKIERDPTLPFIVIAGNTGTPAILEGTGDPEGVIEAPIGCLFVSTGATPARLHFKAVGDGTAGWVEISP